MVCEIILYIILVYSPVYKVSVWIHSVLMYILLK